MRGAETLTENSSDAMRALNQMLAQQAIQGDELRTELSTRIPLTHETLVGASNGAAKTVGEFNKMMEEGKFHGRSGDRRAVQPGAPPAGYWPEGGEAAKGAGPPWRVLVRR